MKSSEKVELARVDSFHETAAPASFSSAPFPFSPSKGRILHATVLKNECTRQRCLCVREKSTAPGSSLNRNPRRAIFLEFRHPTGRYFFLSF